MNHMPQILGIGIQDFEKIRKNNIFYLDKTHFLTKWWRGMDDVTLITRPRRFGKTLMLNTAEHFFSNRYPNDSILFEGLSVWEEEGMRKEQGQYPVIFLSFAAIKEGSYAKMMESFSLLLAGKFTEYSFLMEGDLLKEEEKEYFLSVRRQQAEGVKLEESISFLCRCLCRYYGKKVILLIDEYDTPIQEAYVKGFWNEIMDFLRVFFHFSLKSNECLERALLTGITRVSKESIFSDLNNLRVVTVSSNDYEDCFGFTEEEVFEQLELYGLEKEKENVKQWYNGLIFGKNTEIYNPWSVLNFLKEREYDTYWANTSQNSLVEKMLRQGDRETKENVMALLQGKTIYAQIDEQLSFPELDQKRNAVWSLLLTTGYLKCVGRRNYMEYELKLTNYEVQLMFEKMVRGWFLETEHYNDFVQALLNGNKKDMNAYMNRVAKSMFSFFDTGNRPSEETQPERFYHGFVLGLMVDLEDRYVITSNRESGFGRYDVMMEPRQKGLDGIILEFKVLDPEEEKELSDTVTAALLQIKEKEYEAQLKEKGVEKVRSYGIAFQGKHVLIDGNGE
jgi:hypothetical protein